MTRYVVLHRKDGGWTGETRVEAHSPDAAIRKVLDGEGGSKTVGGTGIYVAVPERSWKPVQVSVKQERKVSLAPATTEKPATQEQK